MTRTPEQSQPSASQAREQIHVDDSKTTSPYANFCRVMGTPTEPIVVTQRIVMNFYTAKWMLHALAMTDQRHEATYGELEVDIQKRV